MGAEYGFAKKVIFSMWCGKKTFVIYKRYTIGDHFIQYLDRSLKKSVSKYT